MKRSVRYFRRPRPAVLGPGVLCFVVAGLTAGLVATETGAQTAPDFASVRSEIRSVLVAWDEPSMAVAVAVEGAIVWEEGFGWADRERRIPATEHTMYSLASISKPITATGLMVLVERGLIDLDRPANDYLGPAKIDGRAFDAGRATVRHVASHTAGLPLHYQFFYEDEPYRRPHMDETIRRYANLVTAPDERWNYSNLGYGILDYIIERVSGQSYPDYMRDEVLQPLGLTRTSVDIGPGLEDFAATRYATDQGPIPFYDFDHPGGSAVFSSAHDLVRFGMFHLGHDLGYQRRIISDAAIEAMRRPIRESAPGDAYGLGWVMRELPGGLRLQRHGGGMGGVRTELAIAPEENAAVVVLMNSASPLTGYISNLIWHTLYPDAVPKPTPPELPDPHRLEREGILEDAGDGAAPLIEFTPMPDLTGDWVGEVDTHLGPHRLALAIDDGGRVHVQLADQLWTLLNNARLDGEYLRGGFKGDIGTGDANRTDYVLSFELRLRGVVLNGSVTAITLPNVRLGNALTHWAELEAASLRPQRVPLPATAIRETIRDRTRETACGKKRMEMKRSKRPDRRCGIAIGLTPRAFARRASALSGIALCMVACGPRGDAADAPPPPPPARAEAAQTEAEAVAAAHLDYLVENYEKSEHMVPMRDGIELYTLVYTPRDRSREYPILLFRTPYSIGPYEPGEYRNPLGPSTEFDEAGYIFAFQDVRGQFKSEGEFEVIRPPAPEPRGPTDTDEITDNYDAIEWLLANVENHNGRVGQWGISYPGWQTVMGMVDAHPALVAASPQASPSDMFIGDDWHHNGAFRIMYAFSWLSGNARRRDGPTETRGARFDYGTPSGYDFFLNAGSAATVDELYFHGDVPAWRDFIEHPDYDDFWQRQNALRYLDDVRPATLNVAGWFDTEDFYGPMSIYRTVEVENPGLENTLVVGPWLHGGWARMDGDFLGCIAFDSKTSLHFQREFQFPFFEYHLKDEGTWDATEANVFLTGSNEWRAYDSWPPAGVTSTSLYLGSDGTLSFEPPTRTGDSAADTYVSDPANPVPFSAEERTTLGHLWKVEDQRFASERPDVLVYQSEPLEEDLTIAGPIGAEVFVSTTGTDADWVVKLIDIYPDDAPASPNCDVPMGGYQMHLAGEIMRGRFRNDLEDPEPMVPGEVTRIEIDLRDRFHTFKAGHRLMVHVQSSWFPAYDRNPQRFVDTYRASPGDYEIATQIVYRSAEHPSRLVLGVLPR